MPNTNPFKAVFCTNESEANVAAAERAEATGRPWVPHKWRTDTDQWIVLPEPQVGDLVEVIQFHSTLVTGKIVTIVGATLCVEDYRGALTYHRDFGAGLYQGKISDRTYAVRIHGKPETPESA